MELARNQTGIPGMGVAIIHKGKLIFAEGFGKRNKKDPFTPEVTPDIWLSCFVRCSKSHKPITFLYVFTLDPIHARILD